MIPDVNECQLSSTRGRLCNGFCENVPGSFRCTCPPGFRLSDNARECIGKVFLRYACQKVILRDQVYTYNREFVLCWNDGLLRLTYDVMLKHYIT